jgi:hypothetical protein
MQETALNDSVDDQFQTLREANIKTRQQLELAEARISAANHQIDQLAAIQLLSSQIFLGDYILQVPYDVAGDPRPSGQIIQAVLAIPGGLGCIFWDSEELAQLESTPEFQYEALQRFEPFDDCAPAVKARLVPQAGPLLDRLLEALKQS